MLTIDTQTLYALCCDRCRTDFELRDWTPASKGELARAAAQDGWREYLDGVCRPARVWLCPDCWRDVRLEQSLLIGEEAR